LYYRNKEAGMSGLFKDGSISRRGFAGQDRFAGSPAGGSGTGGSPKRAGQVPATGKDGAEAADTGNPVSSPASGGTGRIRLHPNGKTLILRLMAERQYVAGDPKVDAAGLKTCNYRASASEAEAAVGRNARDLQRIKLAGSGVNADTLIRNTFVALPGVPNTLYKQGSRKQF
jgi:hypothetical protein